MALSLAPCSATLPACRSTNWARPRFATPRSSPAASRSRTLVGVVRAQGEPEGFKRNAAQEALKNLDSSVRTAQADLGRSINEAFAPFGKAIGMGSRDKAIDGKPPKNKSWAATQAYLKSMKLESVDGQEAEKLIRKGHVMVVVQPKEDFQKFHPKGSVNVPLYQYLNNLSSPTQAIRKLAYAAQGVTAIEDNPNFVPELKKAAKGAKGLIFACNAGGTIKPTPNFPSGQASRSLIACSQAFQELEKIPIRHLKGGLNIYFRQGFAGEGDDDGWEDTSGRVPYIPGFTVDQDSKELM